jgi:nucleoside-diphosphate-sugar epimerase
MSEVTVVGGAGFIGSRLVQRFVQLNIDHATLNSRDDFAGRDLGCLVYCVGVTSDFRTRPFETIEAHVCHLARVLGSANVSSLIYLSSCRMYRRCPSPVSESTPIPLLPSDPDDLYDASKAAGEAMCLSSGRPTIILRLSNVYGTDVTSPAFLPSVIRDAVCGGEVRMRQSATSCKDYVSVDDVVSVISAMAADGARFSLYNVASGVNVTHGAIADRLKEVTGCQIFWEPRVPRLEPPLVTIDRLKGELNYEPASVLDDLPALVNTYRRLLMP